MYDGNTSGKDAEAYYPEEGTAYQEVTPNFSDGEYMTTQHLDMDNEGGYLDVSAGRDDDEEPGYLDVGLRRIMGVLLSVCQDQGSHPFPLFRSAMTNCLLSPLAFGLSCPPLSYQGLSNISGFLLLCEIQAVSSVGRFVSSNAVRGRVLRIVASPQLPHLVPISMCVESVFIAFRREGRAGLLIVACSARFVSLHSSTLVSKA